MTKTMAGSTHQASRRIVSPQPRRRICTTSTPISGLLLLLLCLVGDVELEVTALFADEGHDHEAGARAYRRVNTRSFHADESLEGLGAIHPGFWMIDAVALPFLDWHALAPRVSGCCTGGM